MDFMDYMLGQKKVSSFGGLWNNKYETGVQN